MTHDEARALGLRLLAACAALGIDPYRIGMPVRHDHADGLAVVVSSAERILGIHAVAGAWSGHTGSQHCWPDLREGAGKGIALELVREAWGDPSVYVERWFDRTWTAMGPDEEHDGELTPSCPTEAEALVAAIETKAALR